MVACRNERKHIVALLESILEAACVNQYAAIFGTTSAETPLRQRIVAGGHAERFGLIIRGPGRE